MSLAVRLDFRRSLMSGPCLSAGSFPKQWLVIKPTWQLALENFPDTSLFCYASYEYWRELCFCFHLFPAIISKQIAWNSFFSVGRHWHPWQGSLLVFLVWQALKASSDPKCSCMVSKLPCKPQLPGSCQDRQDVCVVSVPSNKGSLKRIVIIGVHPKWRSLGIIAAWWSP